MTRILALAIAAILLVSGPSLAQNKPGCGTAAATPAATPPTQGSNSGTAPGNMGSNAWSGGTGGSYIGTNPQGPTPGSPSDQPATARGLDPTKPSAATSQETTC